MTPDTETDAFLSAMRQMASTVNIVTTLAGPDQVYRGLTATAFCSVTAAPPSVLVCVNKSAGTHDAIFDSGVFCVNVLSAQQRDIALLFSSAANPRQRFETGRWSQRISGAPVLEGCVANFDCTVMDSVSASTHTIFIGKAVYTAEDPGRSPLIYCNREFSSLA